MKHFASLVLLLLVLGTAESFAQVLVKDSTVAIYPYFTKNDTLVYYRDNVEYTVNGKDTTYTSADTDQYMVICNKANDKKGYTLEVTFLGCETDSTVLPKGDEDMKSKMSQEIEELMNKAAVGMKVEFSLNAEGDKLEIVNSDKVIKDLNERISKALDTFKASNPLIGSFLPKDAMMELLKGLANNPETLLESYDEVTQLFEFHGNGYTLNETKESTDSDNPNYTRPSEFKLVAIAEPEEGKEVADWDDYALVISNTEYYDSEKQALENVKQLAPDATLEQLKELLGDKMPKGEVVNVEVYENHYFGDGWPKELTHVVSSTQLDSGEEKVEIHHIEWDSRSVGNK